MFKSCLLGFSLIATPFALAQSGSQLSGQVVYLSADEHSAAFELDVTNSCGSSNFFIDASGNSFASSLSALQSSQSSSSAVTVTVSSCQGVVAIVSDVVTS